MITYKSDSINSISFDNNLYFLLRIIMVLVKIEYTKVCLKSNKTIGTLYKIGIALNK